MGQKFLCLPLNHKEEHQMNGPDILSDLRAQLAQELGCSTQVPLPAPLPISPWVAMSLLQKAIRRGEEPFAFQAAATLLHSSPDRLWRRLGGIAFEDIGLADVESVSLVTAALGGKRLRASVGGEWAVASYLVSRMVHAPKNRATDDLLMTAELHPAFEGDRLELTYGTLSELLGIATGQDEILRRALALWYAVGTDRRPAPGQSLSRVRPSMRGGIPPFRGRGLKGRLPANRRGSRTLPLPALPRPSGCAKEHGR